MKALRMVLITLLGLLIIAVVLRFIGICIALIKDFSSVSSNASYLLGSFVGTLVLCVLFAWLINNLWKKNKGEGPPPPSPQDTTR